MGINSGIAWTDHTWNPWQGCHPVSEACDNCYMYREKKQYGQDPTKVVRSKPKTFNAPLQWKDPARVFVCSWSDFFIEEADPWRMEAWEIMEKTPHLTYLILTKRPQRIGMGNCSKIKVPGHWLSDFGRKVTLPRNIWLGVTVEKSDHINRFQRLTHVDASVKFISAEPLLDDLGTYLTSLYCHIEDGGKTPKLIGGSDCDWIITGSESGPNARPTNIEWIKTLRDFCKRQGIAFFFKQFGTGKALDKNPKLDNMIWNEIPNVKNEEKDKEADNRPSASCS